MCTDVPIERVIEEIVVAGYRYMLLCLSLSNWVLRPMVYNDLVN